MATEAYTVKSKLSVFDEAFLNEAKFNCNNNDFIIKRNSKHLLFLRLDSDLNSTILIIYSGGWNCWSVADLSCSWSHQELRMTLYLFMEDLVSEKLILTNAIGNKVLHDNPQARIK